MITYLALLVLAALFNTSNARVLVLTAIVGAGIFTPIPTEHFYMWCISVEVLVCLFAYMVGGGPGFAIITFSLSLILCHAMGILMDGYTSRAYHYLVRIFEHSELVVCMIGSRVRRL